jgi:Fe2+ transport system protein FeoA
MTDRALARIDLSAVKRNCAELRRRLDGAELCAVVKADGYGHGAAWCARAAIAGGAGWLAVATADEAGDLRRHGIRERLLVMGALTPEEVEIALAADADMVAWRTGFVRLAERKAEAAGIAAAAKALKPDIKVIGISMERGAAMKASLDAGRPVLVEELPTLADSLGGGIGLDNRLTFQMCRDLLDDVVLLSEAEIAAGIVHAYAEEREIVEGAGAVGIAALLAGKARPKGPTVVLLSGGNIDMALHRKIVCGEGR